MWYVYAIISVSGKMENVPFSKRSLKTLCGKLNREHADDDVKKTIEVFKEIQVEDPGFTYTQWRSYLVPAGCTGTRVALFFTL